MLDEEKRKNLSESEKRRERKNRIQLAHKLSKLSEVEQNRLSLIKSKSESIHKNIQAKQELIVAPRKREIENKDEEHAQKLLEKEQLHDQNVEKAKRSKSKELDERKMTFEQRRQMHINRIKELEREQRRQKKALKLEIKLSNY